jgi:hypothetical protein
MLNKKNIYFLIFKFLLVLLEIKKKIQTNFKFKFLIPGGQAYGLPIWTPNMDPEYGPPIGPRIWSHILYPQNGPQNMDPQYGPQIWTLNMDPKYGHPYGPPIWTLNNVQSSHHAEGRVDPKVLALCQDYCFWIPQSM